MNILQTNTSTSTLIVKNTTKKLNKKKICQYMLSEHYIATNVYIQTS
jgi:hypothetical protein